MIEAKGRLSLLHQLSSKILHPYYARLQVRDEVILQRENNNA